MKKVRYLAGLAGIVPVAAGVAVPAAAHAATAEQGTAVTAKTVSLSHVRASAAPEVAALHSCFDLESNGKYGWCNGTILSNTKLYPTSGGKPWKLPAGDRVKVTCWYKGAPGSDSYYDHVVREKSLSGSPGPFSVWGHVSDIYVSLGGTPNNFLNRC